MQEHATNDPAPAEEPALVQLHECKCTDPRPKFMPKDPAPTSTDVVTVCARCGGWLPVSYADRTITVLEHYKRTLPDLAIGSRVRRQIGNYSVPFIKTVDGWEYDHATMNKKKSRRRR